MKLLAAVVLTAVLSGCASAPAPVAGGDEFDIQATVLAVYNVISGPAGRRDWRQFETLFAPDARLVVSSVTDGVPATVVMTTKEYVERSTPRFNERGWFERGRDARAALRRRRARLEHV